MHYQELLALFQHVEVGNFWIHPLPVKVVLTLVQNVILIQLIAQIATQLLLVMALMVVLVLMGIMKI